MPDIEFTETRDGLPAITIPFRSDRLGVDGVMMTDWFDSALWALGKLREGHWDTPSGADAVREIGHAINALDHRLAPRLDGLKAALIRAHKRAGGSVGELANAMDVARSTAQGRLDRTLTAPVSSWETWARSGGPQPPVPVQGQTAPPLRRLALGDRVRTLADLTATWINDDREETVAIQRGTIGTVVLVRNNPEAPPYVIAFGDGDHGASVEERAIEKVEVGVTGRVRCTGCHRSDGYHDSDCPELPAPPQPANDDDQLSRDFPEFNQESRHPNPNPDPVMDTEGAKAELAEIIHYMHTELDNERSDRQYMAEQALARLEELRDSI